MYTIYNKKKDMYCRWNESIIMFDTKEQCHEFMKAIPNFFDNEMEYIEIRSISKEELEDVDSVYYNNLDKSSFSKENDAVKKNNDMKEELKNG